MAPGGCCVGCEASAGVPARAPARALQGSQGRRVAAAGMLYNLVSALYGRESIFSKTHTNEFCGKINLAHEPGVAGSGAEVGRRVYEEKQSKLETASGAATSNVPYLTQ